MNYKKVWKFAEGGSVPLPNEDPRRDYRKARRDIKAPRVTIMEDWIGRFSPSKADSNAFRQAIEDDAVETIRKYEK